MREENMQAAMVQGKRRRWIRLFMLTAVLTSLILCGVQAETMAMIADLHMSMDTEAYAQLLDAIEETAGKTDVLLFLGDNTNNGRVEEHTAFLAYLDRVKKATGKTVYVIPGNHDLTGSTTPDVFKARYAAFGWQQAFALDENSASYAVLTPGGTCLLMLDTNAYDPGTRMTEYGETSKSLVAWTKTVLESLPEGMDVIAIGHYPLLPYGEGRDSTRNAEEMAGLLTAHGVEAYFCGHRHNNYTLYADGLRQVTIGVPTGYPAWAGTLEREENAWHYRVMPLYDPESETWKQMAAGARTMAERMGSGSLENTDYAGDEEAIAWFAEAMMAELESTVNEHREELLAREGCAKWRKAQVRSVTKEWILGILDQGAEDVKDIVIPLIP